MRVPLRHFPHRVTLRPIDPVGSSVGPTYLEAREGVPALINPKASQRADGREGSPTNGQLIATTAWVTMPPEYGVAPGSLVILHPGTPDEATVTVVTAAVYRHPKAPETAQVWTV